jgi:hypothetical protein
MHYNGDGDFAGLTLRGLSWRGDGTYMSKEAILSKSIQTELPDFNCYAKVVPVSNDVIFREKLFAISKQDQAKTKRVRQKKRKANNESVAAAAAVIVKDRNEKIARCLARGILFCPKCPRQFQRKHHLDSHMRAGIHSYQIHRQSKSSSDTSTFSYDNVTPFGECSMEDMILGCIHTAVTDVTSTILNNILVDNRKELVFTIEDKRELLLGGGHIVPSRPGQHAALNKYRTTTKPSAEMYRSVLAEFSLGEESAGGTKGQQVLPEAAMTRLKLAGTSKGAELYSHMAHMKRSDSGFPRFGVWEIFSASQLKGYFSKSIKHLQQLVRNQETREKASDDQEEEKNNNENGQDDICICVEKIDGKTTECIVCNKLFHCECVAFVPADSEGIDGYIVPADGEGIDGYICDTCSEGIMGDSGGNNSDGNDSDGNDSDQC